MPLYAYFPNPPNGIFLDAFHERLREDVRVAYGKMPDPKDFEILITGRPEREQIQANSKLRSLVIPYAGVPEETRALLREFPKVSVHNLHHNAAPTAEMAVALMLAATKAIVPADQALRKGDWTARYSDRTGLLLENKTALVLGYGQIGRRIARCCRGLGMRVVAIRRGGPLGFSDVPDEIHGPEDLTALLPRARVLVCCVPATEETLGLLGAKELELLPRESVVVNVGRGPVIDEKALFLALKNGTVAAAGLDVWYRYPKSEKARKNTLPSEYPFHELPNVVLSPHRGGMTDDTEELRAAHLAKLLNTAANGGTMPNRVDLGSGY
ncbi:MAG: 2-hydroxyacid dehydrogenase [Planctomycetota bacterium]|nr:2-hydroxyacid dehydrogenase [Planctomycetota bacterium]